MNRECSHFSAENPKDNLEIYTASALRVALPPPAARLGLVRGREAEGEGGEAGPGGGGQGAQAEAVDPLAPRRLVGAPQPHPLPPPAAPNSRAAPSRLPRHGR
jgi:hypothetical protein